jgi:DegV family protein with EDD domain
VAVVTDSTADLSRELAASQGITVVPLTVILDGDSLLDGVDVTAEEFYLRLPRGHSHPTTSQPSAGRFKEVYERLLEDHDEVLSLHISGRLSGTLSSAQQAAGMIGGGRIQVLDSEFASMPLGALALVAAAAARGGAGAAEVAAEVIRVRRSTRCHFAVSTLEYLRRGGRIGNARALLGSVLQIKPILAIEGGEVVPVEQVRTMGRALGRLVELTKTVDPGGRLCLVIGHAGDVGLAREVAERLEDRVETLLIHAIGPVVGTHTGPGTVGIAAYPAALFPLGLGTPLAAGVSR